jgi:PAS domain S-box-containing protein
LNYPDKQICVKQPDQYMKSVTDDSAAAANVDFVLENITQSNSSPEFNERIYRFVLNMPVVLFELDINDNVVFVNDSAISVTGYSPSNLLGKNFWSVIFPDNYIEQAEKLNQEIKNINFVKGEFFITTADKSPMTVFMALSPARNDTGEIIGTLGFLMDARHHQESANRLAENEKKYNKLLEATSEGVMIHDSGEILEINDSLVQMTGYSLEELRNVDAIEILVLEKYKSLVRKNIQSAYEGSYEIECRKKDGTIIPIRINSKNMMYIGRKVRLLIVTDLTEQKKIEMELRRERDLFSKIADTSPTGIIHFDRDGKAIFANKMIKKILALKDGDVLDWTYNDPRWDIRGIDGNRISENDLPFIKVFETGESIQNFLMDVNLPIGKRIFVSINNSPVFDENQEITGVIATVEDITERIIAEKKLKSLNQQLVEHAENLSKSNTDLENFAYIASHDLREPLRMVSGFVRLLESKYKSRLDREADEYINYITDGVERMDKLINDLLSLSRISTRKQNLKPVDCNAVLKQVKMSLKHIIDERKTEIIYDDLPVITADPLQMSQLFQNLVSNAVKFCSTQPEIRISVKNTGQYWEFSVQDNGIGIDPKNFQRIFQSFQRLHTRDEYAGSGMGLAICKKILERHKGEIRVESEPGKGSTFIFKIPVITDTEKDC